MLKREGTTLLHAKTLTSLHSHAARDTPQILLSELPPCYLTNSVYSTATSLFLSASSLLLSSLLTTNTTTGDGAATSITSTNAVAPGRGEAKPAVPAPARAGSRRGCSRAAGGSTIRAEEPDGVGRGGNPSSRPGEGT